MTEWRMERLPPPTAGHSLDLDSTVFERHGQQQEGAMKGYNPRWQGRLSHPLAGCAGGDPFHHAWLDAQRQ